MDLSRVDLNLLVVFEAVLEEKSVTEAGRRLGLSQPATSAAISKLRALFNDPVFVKTTRGMEPTPLATQLAVPVRQASGIIQNRVEMRYPNSESGVLGVRA